MLRALASSVINVLHRTLIGPRGITGIVIAVIMALKLKKAALKCRTIEDFVNLAYSLRSTRLSVRPLQIKEEISVLLKLLVRVRPKLILEIGTAGGGTLFLLSRVASSDATLISIDLPNGPFGGGYPKWKIPLYKSFVWGQQKIILVEADSHNPATLEDIEKSLSDRKLDFLFVDGDHAYDGVKRDFEMYGRLVRSGSIIAFHDIVPGPPENVGGVPEFWTEIKQNADSVEIVENWEQGGFGIGVVFV